MGKSLRKKCKQCKKLIPRDGPEVCLGGCAWTTKKCQTCKRMIPRAGPPACAGSCTEKFEQRRKTYRGSTKGKKAQIEWHNKEEGKASRASIAKRYNGTTKGKIAKQRADAVFRSTPTGKMHHTVQERLRRMGRIGVGSSKKVLKWIGFDSADGVVKWLSDQKQTKGLSEDVPLDINHVIPYYAYTWVLEGNNVVRNKELQESEFKKLWDPRNLQLITASANRKKRCALPTDDDLNARKDLWPGWWGGIMPDESLRNRLRKGVGKVMLP